jgi:hypothetical protein
MKLMMQYIAWDVGDNQIENIKNKKIIWHLQVSIFVESIIIKDELNFESHGIFLPEMHISSEIKRFKFIIILF